MLIDTHAHLYWESFKNDLGIVVKRALESGISTIINVGVDVELSRKALIQIKTDLVIAGLNSYSTIGIHPHEAIKYFTNPDVSIHNDIIKLEQIYQSSTSKVIAVGECGLDFYFDNNPDHNPTSLPIKYQKELQIKLFQAQIDLANKLNLPLLIHCRDDRSNNLQNCEAWEKVLMMIGNHPAILHCYSGLNNITHKVLKMPNVLISFASTITYPKNEYLREAVKVIPLDRIVLETDCPFLPPQSKRGQRNEPANIIEIAQSIAQHKEISLNEVSAQTTANSKKIFKI